jgi:hypothetical protein
MFTEKENRKNMGIASNNIGNIHFKYKRFKEAVQYYKDAVKWAEEEL